MFFRKTRLNSNDNTPVVTAPTYVARDTTFQGNLSSDGEIHVDGLVRGSLKARVCIIDTNGTVEGETEADQVIVRGRAIGPLRGLHVHLQEGAHVEGDITSETIAVDNGAHLQGAVWRSGETQNALPRHEPAALLNNPLWSRFDDDSLRPLKVVRPR